MLSETVENGADAESRGGEEKEEVNEAASQEKSPEAEEKEASERQEEGEGQRVRAEP